MFDPKRFLQELLLTAAQQGASDVHLSPGNYPVLRIDGRLTPLPEQQTLDRAATEGVLTLMLGGDASQLAKGEDLQFSYELEGKMRFRVSAYRTKGIWAAVLRTIPEEVRTVDDLNLPAVVKVFGKLSQGLVLVVGPRGHGKSTTLAALLDIVNRERAEKIITLEQPIEYVLRANKSVIDQRAVGRDVPSFAQGLTALPREDANVVLVGELPDAATVDAALTVAEMGHLVFAPYYTGTSAQTLERPLGLFPPDRQDAVRLRLAGTIAGIISQRLVPRIRGGLIPAVEVMVATTAVRTHIRDGKLSQIQQAIETGSAMGMLSLDRSLADLVRRKEISIENAEFFSLNPSSMRSLAS